MISVLVACVSCASFVATRGGSVQSGQSMRPDGRCEQEEEADVVAAHVMLLQQSLRKQPLAPTNLSAAGDIDPTQRSFSVLRGSTAEERLDRLKPIAWVHVPKTGSSFLNVLILHNQICPSLPDGTTILEPRDVFDAHDVNASCPGAFSTTYLSPPGHAGIGDVYEANAGHGVIMLRQPEQRLMSGYLHTEPHGFPHGWPQPEMPPQNFQEYADVMSGCVVKMLTRGGRAMGADPTTCAGPAATDAETALAVTRLGDGFPFVGLTEEWKLSVCLFLAMFGGECQPEMLENTRPGRSRTQGDNYDVEGFQDWADRAVYEEGLQIFNRNLAIFGVTPETCDLMCPFDHSALLQTVQVNEEEGHRKALVKDVRRSD